MNKFKIGDKVKRINDDNFGVKVGDIATIVGVSNDRDGNYYKLDIGNKDEDHDEGNLTLITLTEKNLDNLEEGDILIDKNGYKIKILGICGKVYFLSAYNDFEISGYHYSIKGIKEQFILENPTPEATETIIIGGITYSKKDVEEKLKGIKAITN